MTHSPPSSYVLSSVRIASCECCEGCTQGMNVPGYVLEAGGVSLGHGTLQGGGVPLTSCRE